MARPAVSQFGAPRGLRGWVAARVVDRLAGDANRWMVDLCGIEPSHRVLDVGCGPGLGLAAALDRAPDGLVAGVDAAPAMVRLARRRSRAAMAAGRAHVLRAQAAHLPFRDARFDRCWSLNSLQFWPSVGAGMGEVGRVTRPGGRVVIGLMARSDDPAGRRPRWLDAVGAEMERSGISDVAYEARTFGGVAHWALVGSRSGPSVRLTS